MLCDGRIPAATTAWVSGAVSRAVGSHRLPWGGGEFVGATLDLVANRPPEFGGGSVRVNPATPDELIPCGVPFLVGPASAGKHLHGSGANGGGRHKRLTRTDVGGQ